ncbi:gluconate 2-dehydrogenase subunit 3 family protein [Aegicerativicinus sediminis]|uniref:gluconate 2-dehydrogenase subunit 3 family protein n=1 Tax=Aegicerativicinus sediminis TaxID=2893202 RepID=UPI001E4E7300|nr:gluconate 2-dehydrogenase subunit 3 family protein [Aegicerativicinus sediminis]
MKRREVLKNLGLTTGFVIASPSIFSLLQSCKTEVEYWQPAFLNQDHGIILKGIVDVFLPKTQETPSANDVNVAEFIDKYVNEIYTVEEQEEFKAGMDELANHLKTTFNEDLSKISAENYKTTLDNEMHFDRSQSSVLSNTLNRLRNMSISAYRISEQVGENVLAYDPIPGGYFCGDLQELTKGKSWSL